MKPRYEIAHILQQHREEIDQWIPNSWKARTLFAMADCRTINMGGHIDRCDNPECGAIHISYNSCRNRHCPKCQGHKREQWVRQRENELLNVPYYHLVFTLPAELNSMALFNPKLLYDLLFDVTWKVVNGFALNPKFIGAKTGMIAILHTWGQNIALHPHLHCLVPAGGLTPQKRWRPAKKKEKFLFPVKEVSKVFRAKMVEALRKNIQLPQALYDALFSKKWHIHCSAPFCGTKQVIEYQGRYTYKVAMSNHRIKEIDADTVTFSAKDYKRAGKKHLITLNHEQFIKRFALHILPKRFIRIRYYGILASAIKKQVRLHIEKQIGKPLVIIRPPIKHRICFKCGTGKLLTIKTFSNRGPPKVIMLDGRILELTKITS